MELVSLNRPNEQNVALSLLYENRLPGARYGKGNLTATGAAQRSTPQHSDSRAQPLPVAVPVAALAIEPDGLFRPPRR